MNTTAGRRPLSSFLRGDAYLKATKYLMTIIGKWHLPDNTSNSSWRSPTRKSQLESSCPGCKWEVTLTLKSTGGITLHKFRGPFPFCRLYLWDLQSTFIYHCRFRNTGHPYRRCRPILFFCPADQSCHLCYQIGNK